MSRMRGHWNSLSNGWCVNEYAEHTDFMNRMSAFAATWADAYLEIRPGLAGISLGERPREPLLWLS